MDFFDVHIPEIIPDFHGEHCDSERPVYVLLFAFEILFVPQNELDGDCIEYPVFDHCLLFNDVFKFDGGILSDLFEIFPSLFV
jgi:hypothetical protein